MSDVSSVSAQPESAANSQLSQEFAQLRSSLNQRILGQEVLVDRLLIALLADGHLLVEGAPGLAKTAAIKALATNIEGDFHRVQFTPDLLPADITGTDIWRPQDGSFEFQAGPIFHNLVLADEINRAPAKVQSALLEAMAERQVTVGQNSYPLSDVFLVMATQNPIEQEGTYPLPEAQLDRFVMFSRIDYPRAEVEREILALHRRGGPEAMAPSHPPVSLVSIRQAREAIMQLYLSEPMEQYLVALIAASRRPAEIGQDLARWIAFGASPRGTLALERCARAHAWLNGCDYVGPGDLHAIVHDVLRHRILLSFEAEADGVSVDDVIDELIKRVPLP
jgi:MoxR-like ATPase